MPNPATTAITNEIARVQPIAIPADEDVEPEPERPEQRGVLWEIAGARKP